MSVLTECRPFAQEVNTKEILLSMGYTVGRKLGKGTYSKVCVATLNAEKKKKICACKIINMKKSEKEFIKRFLPREIEIVAKIEHPNIVNVFEIIEIKNYIFMFMDYCRNGDLLEFIRSHGPLSESKAKNYFRQIISAVLYIHNLDIAHRDLKCENIFLSAGYSIKLGDFGFARNCTEKKAKVLSNTFCGSAAYAAPEVLQGIMYDPKMYDIWALGCTLYIMLLATMPFDDYNTKNMLKAQMDLTACKTMSRMGFSNSLKTLMSSLLAPKVSKRATIQQVSKCVWFNEECSPKHKKLLISVSDTVIPKKRTK